MGERRQAPMRPRAELRGCQSGNLDIEGPGRDGASAHVGRRGGRATARRAGAELTPEPFDVTVASSDVGMYVGHDLVKGLALVGVDVRRPWLVLSGHDGFPQDSTVTDDVLHALRVGACSEPIPRQPFGQALEEHALPVSLSHRSFHLPRREVASTVRPVDPRFAKAGCPLLEGLHQRVRCCVARRVICHPIFLHRLPRPLDRSAVHLEKDDRHCRVTGRMSGDTGRRPARR